jgi:F-type H+/Na+-transporting ATPase subunit alpha
MNTYLQALQTLKTHISGDIKKIKIMSAGPTDPSVVAGIRELFGDAVIVQTTVDASMIDGVQFQIGDFVLDSSTASQIDALQRAIQMGTHTDDVFADMRAAVLGYQVSAETSEVGVVESVRDGVCIVTGLQGVFSMELLTIGDIQGLALNLNKDSVGVIILGDASSIQVGSVVMRSKKLASVGVSDAIIGRVVDPLSRILDTGSSFVPAVYNPIERVAPGVMTRQPVEVPLQTGIKAIDALVPIGRGQRELILGDRQTGKTALAIDAILNQKGQDVICVYVAIGQKASKIAKIIEKLKSVGALEYTVVVAATASDPAGMLFLAPYSGVAIAEYFAAKGQDVLIVYDDLTKHAASYREISLLLGRPPGREAYPGDVFYLHSRLLERACNLNAENGGGSITALPIVETLAGDISAYIPTNVISITDGQIFLEADLFYKGQRPAINVGLSVSRVGGAAQTKAMKKVAGSMKLALAQFREVESFAQFSSDLDAATKQQLDRGYRTLEVLKQVNNAPQSLAQQVISIFAVNNGFFDAVGVTEVSKEEKNVQKYVEMTARELFVQLDAGKWGDDIAAELSRVCGEYFSMTKQA